MKVWVYQESDGSLKLKTTHWCNTNQILGTLDLDIQKEKKWVTKNEMAVLSKCDYNKCSIKNTIPLTSRNTIITYEVEE
jgi:hypothetical protein